MILFKFSPLLQAASPSCQTHAFRTLASQPRLTRRETSGLLQLVSGRGARGGWPHYALFGLTKLHREVLRAYTATRTRAGAVWRGWVANCRREERVRFYGIKPQFNADLSR